jgi:multisubunit Na+/H+ antiporter MnhC subunit
MENPMILTYFVIGVAILLGVLLMIYWTGYRGLPQDDFNPVVLWIDHNSNLVPSN